MVLIKYALVGCLVALGLFAYSKRDDVVDAYHWEPTIEKPFIPAFDPQAVADEHRTSVPDSDIRISLGPDTRSVPVPTVAAATSTTGLPMQGGKSSIDGVVVAPDGGPVAGAVVRLERFVGDDVVTVDVATNGAGNFAVSQLLGGRYRVRAWKAPTMAQLGSDVTFISDGEARSFRLQLHAPTDIDISASVSSSAVIVGQQTTASMRILVPVVNGNGQVDRGGRANDLVVATGGGVLGGPSGPTTDNPEGPPCVPFSCSRIGAGTITMQTPYYRQVLDINCLPVPTTTTTTTTLPGATTTTATVPTTARPG